VRRLLAYAAVFALGALVLRVAVVPAEVCPSLTPAQARTAIAEAAGWLERGVQPDGRYTYGYDREADLVSSDYNITRHAGVMMGLYSLAAATGDDEALAAAEHGLPFVRRNLLRHGDWIAFAEPGQDARLGASALVAAALAQRRIATGDESEDDLLHGLAAFLRAQQQEDGSVQGAWSRETERPVPDAWSTFGTGQTLWTFALMDRLFPDEGWGEPARRLARYVATRRDEVEGHLLTFPDHWTAYGLAELGPDGLGEPEIAYARELAGILGLNSRLESQSGPDGLRRLMRGEPASGAGLGTVSEGLAQLWRLSRADPRLADLTDDLERRLRCTAGRAADRQVDADEAQAFPRPLLARGAWFTEDGYTQMDHVRHPLSGLLAALPLLDGEQPE
jgi:N-acylglucosamine 2-epimerase (GlcNAc 2-epimerase)